MEINPTAKSFSGKQQPNCSLLIGFCQQLTAIGHPSKHLFNSDYCAGLSAFVLQNQANCFAQDGQNAFVVFTNHVVLIRPVAKGETRGAKPSLRKSDLSRGVYCETKLDSEKIFSNYLIASFSRPVQ